MHRLKPLLVNVGIDLGRGNVSVTQHLLNDAQIGAIAEQMGRKTMSQQMRINIRFEPGTPCHRLYDLPDADRCESASAVGKKNFAAGSAPNESRPLFFKIFREGGTGLAPDRHKSRFVSFPGHPHHPVG